MEATIEKKVAEAILSSKVKIKIGQDTYNVARPTIRTLIAISKEISQIPKLEVEKGNELLSILSVAKECERVGRIFAILILGYKKDTESLRFWQKTKENKQEKEINKLADEILNKHSPKELNHALVDLLSHLEISDFFVLTTSLFGVNVLKRTVED